MITTAAHVTTHFKGISGAPVFSQDNELAGVAISGNSSDELIGFTPVERLRDLAEKAEGKKVLYLSRETQIELLRQIYSFTPEQLKENLLNLVFDLSPDERKKLAPFLSNQLFQRFK